MHRILIALSAFTFVQAPPPAQHFPSDAVLLDLFRAQVGPGPAANRMPHVRRVGIAICG